MNTLPRNTLRSRARSGLAILTMSVVAIGIARAADPMTSATGGKLDGADRKFVEKAAIGG